MTRVLWLLSICTAQGRSVVLTLSLQYLVCSCDRSMRTHIVAPHKSDQVIAASSLDHNAHLGSRSVRCRHPIEAEHVRASAHLSSAVGGVVQNILLRGTEVPVFGKCWTLAACIYSGFFSTTRVRLKHLCSHGCSADLTT